MGLDSHIVAIKVAEPRDPKYGHGVNIVRGPLSPDERQDEVFYARQDWKLHTMIENYVKRAGVVGPINNKAVRLTQAWLRELTRAEGCPALWHNLFLLSQDKHIIYYQGDY